MKIDDIKVQLVRQATIFETGGVRPSHDLLESWIGYVGWSLPGEQRPQGFQPLVTLFFKDLPFVPTSIQHFELLTLFINEEIFDHLIEDDLSCFFEIRAYTSIEGLIQQNWQHDHIRAFPLIPKLIDNDFPTWDGGGIPSDVEDEILRLEHEEDIEYFDDIVEEIYAVHKLGGYPAYCQSGHDYGEDFPFVLQIASDEKAYFKFFQRGSKHPLKELKASGGCH
ncbi:DUF1963 domain-containing protein [Lysinibacillus sp. NPDC094177]|uniref:DUF1963 domain-containing protein n=1 Tax=Lysinibacillus sp. NPDC094177 TaxID=3390580 RepID=UPI003D0696B4